MDNNNLSGSPIEPPQTTESGLRTNNNRGLPDPQPRNQILQQSQAKNHEINQDNKRNQDAWDLEQNGGTFPTADLNLMNTNSINNPLSNYMLQNQLQPQNFYRNGEISRIGSLSYLANMDQTHTWFASTANLDSSSVQLDPVSTSSVAPVHSITDPLINAIMQHKPRQQQFGQQHHIQNLHTPLNLQGDNLRTNDSFGPIDFLSDLANFEQPSTSHTPMENLNSLTTPQANNFGLQRKMMNPSDHSPIEHSVTRTKCASLPQKNMGTPTPVSDKRQKGRPAIFITELYRMLMDLEKQPAEACIASFISQGNAFTINRPKKLVSDVLPRYFRMRSFSSFKRQLHMYGFRQVRIGPGASAYCHDSFVRGQPELLSSIQRVTSKSDEP